MYRCTGYVAYCTAIVYRSNIYMAFCIPPPQRYCVAELYAHCTTSFSVVQSTSAVKSDISSVYTSKLTLNAVAEVDRVVDTGQVT